MGGCGGLLRDAAAADEPGPSSAGPARTAARCRPGLDRLPRQRTSSERQGVRAHGTGHGLRGAGHADRVPAAHRRRCGRRGHASRRSRVGGLRHGPERLVRPRGDPAVFRTRQGPEHDQCFQPGAGGRLRGGVRGQRAGRVRKNLGPSGRVVAPDLASAGVAGRLHGLYLRRGHGGRCGPPYAGPDREPDSGGDSPRARLFLVGASVPGRRPGELWRVPRRRSPPASRAASRR